MDGKNRAVVAIVLGLLALGPLAASGQQKQEIPVGSKPLPANSPLFKRGKDAHVIVQQAQFGLARLKIAVGLLSQATTPENVQSAFVATQEAYYFIRAAHEGTILRQAARNHPDPMLDLQAQQLKTPRYAVAKALGLLNHGSAAPKGAVRAANIIADSITSLEKALVILY